MTSKKQKFDNIIAKIFSITMLVVSALYIFGWIVDPSGAKLFTDIVFTGVFVTASVFVALWEFHFKNKVNEWED